MTKELEQVITHITKEWSNAIPTGVIDTSNIEHIRILSEILYDYEIPDNRRINILNNLTNNLITELDLDKIKFNLVDDKRGDEIEMNTYRLIDTFISEINKQDKEAQAYVKEVKAIGFQKNKNEFRIEVYIYLNGKTNNERKAFIESLSPILEKMNMYYDDRGTSQSSIGSVITTQDNIQYNFIFKGQKKGKGVTDTDQKEGLVSLFYYTPEINVDMITEDNFENIVSDLILQIDSCEGLGNETKAKLGSYLHQVENMTPVINVLNDAYSVSKEMRSAYGSGYTLYRTGVYNQVREVASKITGIPSDKWNPSDIFLIKTSGMSDVLNAVKEASSQATGDYDIQGAIGIINNLFEEDWGDNTGLIVGISLKMQRAQGGKAKSFFQELTKDSDLYNLNKDERDLDEDSMLDLIDDWRQQCIDNFKKSDVNINFQSQGSPSNIDQIRQKFACFKLLLFMSSNVKYRDSDIFTSAAAYAMSLSGVNPTFFKLIGNKSGQAHVTKFEREGGITLQDDVINIIDKKSNGNIQIIFNVTDGDKSGPINMNIRSNGTTQVTIEIKKVSLN